MNDATADYPPVVPPDESTPVPTKRGRKSETPAQRLERLQRAVLEAKHAARVAEQRMFAVVGAAVLEEAEADGVFKARVLDILRKRVTTSAAKSDIASLLV